MMTRTYCYEYPFRTSNSHRAWLMTLMAALLVLVCAGTGSAGYVPGPRMCGWIQIRTDQPNYAAFVVLADGVDLRGLKVTDKGWRGTSFYSGEGGIMTLPSNDAWDNVYSVTVVELGVELDNDPSDGILGCPIPDSTIDLSPEGDQLFLYWGEESAPVFICGIHTKRDQWDTIDYNDENSSVLPDNWAADVAIGWTDRACHNAYYAGPGSFQTDFQARTAVLDIGNWVRSDDPQDIRSFTTILPALWGTPPPWFYFDDRTLSVVEGSGEVTAATFSVWNPGTCYPVTIDYYTSPGTATAGVDFVTNSGTITFPVGVISQQVVVDVIGDSDIEPDETFFVYLSNPSHGIGFDTRPAECTIRNDDGILIKEWKCATAAAPWAPRMGHTSVVYNEKIWVLGGRDEDWEFRNDVWSSEDGKTWVCATDTAEWSARANHTSVVYDGKIWVIGGLQFDATLKNDVWYSSDGESWCAATLSAPWGLRSNHASVVYDGKIWVMGGDRGYSDAWYSSDGENWIMATEAAAWGPRSGHTSVVYDHKMWVIGGKGVWYSTDGSTWVTVATGNMLLDRFDHASVGLGGWLLALGGERGAGGRYSNSVCYSSDGAAWSLSQAQVAWAARADHSAVVFDGKIWVMGGHYKWETTSINHTFYSDVWYANCSGNTPIEERCDINKDGQVDEKDLSILLGEWHKEAKNKPTR